MEFASARKNSTPSIGDRSGRDLSHHPGRRTEHARELLACLKFIIDLERIGDLLLNCSNRAAAVGSRIELQDIRDLTVMASRLEKMLGDVHDAFSQRDLNSALAVLRSDAELDRLRNLIFLRHLENHDGAPRRKASTSCS